MVEDLLRKVEAHEQTLQEKKGSEGVLEKWRTANFAEHGVFSVVCSRRTLLKNHSLRDFRLGPDLTKSS
jgi:hypothetical protein